MEERIDCTKAEMVKAFNEWMRRQIEEPEKFEAEFRTIIRFLEEEKAGEEPSYGELCTAYIKELMNELDQKEQIEGEIVTP